MFEQHYNAEIDIFSCVAMDETNTYLNFIEGRSAYSLRFCYQ